MSVLHVERRSLRTDPTPARAVEPHRGSGAQLHARTGAPVAVAPAGARPSLRTLMMEDLRTARSKDPAARSLVEVALLYPGVHAIWVHRVSHRLWTRPHPHRLLARAISQLGRAITGVEIHPGAVIGRRLFIDHAMGVVIGETAQVGDDVLMFHGTTLGGTTMSHGKRHPTIGNGVLIGAGATVLGPVTVGDGAKIGAGAVVVQDVPAGMVAVGVSARLRPAAADDWWIDPAIYI
jgi:serine O-acetyltransferase